MFNIVFFARSFLSFCLCSSVLYSDTSKIEQAVTQLNQTPVGAESTVYIDKIITVQEVTTVDTERITVESEVVSDFI